MSTTSVIRPERVLVGPAMATEWLKTTPHARKIDRRRVERYRNDMLSGGWRETGEPIRIGTDGHVVNGHHRLTAVAESGVSIWFIVVFGVDPSTRDYQDCGLPKRISDWSSRKNATAGYAMVASLLRATVPESAGWCDSTRFKDIVWDVIGDANIQAFATAGGSRLMNTAPCRMACALINRVDPPRAQQFRAMVSSSEYTKGRPEHAYYQWFDRSGSPMVTEHARVALRVAAAAAAGDTLKLVRGGEIDLSAKTLDPLQLGPLLNAISAERARARR